MHRGLETPDAGDIAIDDMTVFSSHDWIDVPAYRRDLGMVFQSYAIWPHMTVYENVAFPLIYGHRHSNPSDARRKAMRALELVKPAALAERPTPFLSGGQQQRVSCALLAGKSTLNRLELSRAEPTRYHRVSHDPAAIGAVR